MKYITIAFLVTLVALVGCNGQNSGESKISTDLITNSNTNSKSKQNSKKPIFEFEEMAIDFGKISQGEKVKKRFKFKNIGNAPLIISNAAGSCGCTVPFYPKEPIEAGEEDEIEVVFNSNGKKGHVHNKITLIANTVPNKTILALNGEVLIPKQ